MRRTLKAACTESVQECTGDRNSGTKCGSDPDVFHEIRVVKISVIPLKLLKSNKAKGPGAQ
jgi:hypothetical protein